MGKTIGGSRMLEQLQTIFAMGGYGFYVWLAYAMALIVFSVNVILPVYQHRKIIQQIEKQQSLASES